MKTKYVILIASLLITCWIMGRLYLKNPDSDSRPESLESRELPKQLKNSHFQFEFQKSRSKDEELGYTEKKFKPTFAIQRNHLASFAPVYFASFDRIVPQRNTVSTLWRPYRPEPYKSSRYDDRFIALENWVEQLHLDPTFMVDDNVKTILIYNGSKDVDIDSSGIPEDNGPITLFCENKCKFTKTEPDWRKNNTNIDAVMIARSERLSGLHNIPERVIKFIYIMESPKVVSTILGSNDLLASYYRGSDVVYSYGKWIPCKNSKCDSKVTKTKDKGKKGKKSRNYSRGKTKLVAMFDASNMCTYNSNKDSFNNRDGYVEELRKYVKVDIYSSCGTPDCPSHLDSECFDMLKKFYKFFLAFENANCRDYITEKFLWTAIKNEVVPIVLGAHPDDYKAIAPPESYIHVEDFNSPKHLAKYLLQLNENDEAYRRFFQWKQAGTLNFEMIEKPNQKGCRLCAMLYYADLVASPPKRESASSWGSINKCLPNNTWYWTK